LTKQLATFHGGWKPSDNNLFEQICRFLPIDGFRDVFVPSTSKNLIDACKPATNLGVMLFSIS
jgi:hypothetical protein